jgi:two-component system, OmpR family, sensor histidine kinase KdpD
MRNSRRTIHPTRVALRTTYGIGAVGVITAIAYLLQADFPIVGCLYLLVVVVQSVLGSFTSSAIVSLIAVLCLDYFFVPPRFSLTIDRPLDGLALLTFLATALVITRLASRAGEEAQKAEARRKDLARLYELASRLVSVGPDVAVERGYLNLFRSIFHIHAICLFDGAAAAASCDGESRHHLVELTRSAYDRDYDFDDEERGIAIRCLRSNSTAIGAVGFERLNEAGSMAGPLAMLAAAMVQRAHSFKQASEAAAATQLEVLRSAILDAFAHQFKTPLAAILASAGSLRETGPLFPEQKTLVETIETEAAGLGHLTTRLLRMARLDRDEINPQLQVTDLGGLVRRLVNQYADQGNGHKWVIRTPEEPVAVPSDPNILSLAIVQLLDNACRYSPPGSGVTVSADLEETCAAVRVTNEGPPILAEEQNKIFDRFYRGSAGQHTSGTGLGLYVARKIVLAHGGSLELDTGHPHGGTTFCLRLPVSRNGTTDELKASESVGSR